MNAGDGVLIAVAAFIWLAYLLPTWRRRAQDGAAERNAIKLQQTIRVMAASTEANELVRAEASARGVLAQQRALRQRRRLDDKVARASIKAEYAIARAIEQQRVKAAKTKVKPQSVTRGRKQENSEAGALKAKNQTATRKRRGRLLALLLGLSSIIVLVNSIIGIIQISWPANWLGSTTLIPFTALAGIVGSALMLQHLARRANPESAVAHKSNSAAAVADSRLAAGADSRLAAVATRPLPAAVTDQGSWQPKPLPKPLHQSADYRARITIQAAEHAERERRSSLRLAVAKIRRQANRETKLLAVQKFTPPAENSEIASAEDRIARWSQHSLNTVVTAVPGAPGAPSAPRIPGESEVIDLNRLIEQRRRAG